MKKIVKIFISLLVYSKSVQALVKIEDFKELAQRSTKNKIEFCEKMKQNLLQGHNEEEAKILAFYEMPEHTLEAAKRMMIAPLTHYNITSDLEVINLLIKEILEESIFKNKYQDILMLLNGQIIDHDNNIESIDRLINQTGVYRASQGYASRSYLKNNKTDLKCDEYKDWTNYYDHLNYDEKLKGIKAYLRSCLKLIRDFPKTAQSEIQKYYVNNDVPKFKLHSKEAKNLFKNYDNCTLKIKKEWRFNYDKCKLNNPWKLCAKAAEFDFITGLNKCVSDSFYQWMIENETD